MKRKPDWLRTKVPTGAAFERVNARLRSHNLNTVCTSARCPNLDECWNCGTATFMLLGDTCTRHCRFCSVATGNPGGRVDETEPARVAQTAKELRLKYVVLTSVDRDDLDDLGAGVFADTITAVRKAAPGARVEVLAPDFGGRAELIKTVATAGPDVYGHNVETVRRLSPYVRDRRADHDRSLSVLRVAREAGHGMLTKSGIMVGLGETDDEVVGAMGELRMAQCDIVTIGQYLQPKPNCLPVDRYVEPATFDKWQEKALALRFKAAFCSPLVRSSYRAAEVFEG